jgi:hypothetical protein
MKHQISNSDRARAFRFDATLDGWVSYQRGYADAIADITEELIGYAPHHLASAELAAKDHLAGCADTLYEGADDCGSLGPFCGCETCVVREVLYAALPHLEKHFQHKFERQLGFEIDWGTR